MVAQALLAATIYLDAVTVEAAVVPMTAEQVEQEEQAASQVGAEEAVVAAQTRAALQELEPEAKSGFGRIR